MGNSASDKMAFEPVCPSEELPNNSRRCIILPSTGRSVLLVHHNNVIYCLDQACYHHGGPLATGDIEDLGEKIAIKCPWHDYKIDLDTGEGLYMGLDPGNMSKPVLKSKGIRQRTHQVKIENGMIYVLDSTIENTQQIASDVYAFQIKGIPQLGMKKNQDEIKLHSRMS